MVPFFIWAMVGWRSFALLETMTEGVDQTPAEKVIVLITKFLDGMSSDSHVSQTLPALSWRMLGEVSCPTWFVILWTVPNPIEWARWIIKGRMRLVRLRNRSRLSLTGRGFKVYVPLWLSKERS